MRRAPLTITLPSELTTLYQLMAAAKEFRMKCKPSQRRKADAQIVKAADELLEYLTELHWEVRVFEDVAERYRDYFKLPPNRRKSTAP